ncbi:MAG: purine-binding chemotaxis protein CheW [Proteobacteria bacterium]|nr:purine-binding chemotaxis protein CheW [Pseudomonadota bacterium]
MDAEEHVSSDGTSGNQPSEIIQLVIFELDDKLFAVEVLKVQEVIQYSHITPSPGASECIEGIMDVRDGIIPIVELRKCFQMAPYESYKGTKILIAEIQEYVFGFIVDRVEEVCSMPLSDFMAPPAGTVTVGSEYLLGVSRKGQSLLFLLDIEKVLDVHQLLEAMK